MKGKLEDGLAQRKIICYTLEVDFEQPIQNLKPPQARK